MEEKKINFSKLGKYSRQKGKSYEYQCKKLISQYLDIPFEYLETPLDRKGQPIGDLIIAGKYWDRIPLYFDFKKRETFQLQTMFNNFEKSQILTTWLEKSRLLPVEEDRERFVLVWSKNYFPNFIFGLREILDDLIFLDKLTSRCYFYSEFLKKEFAMFNFKEFLYARRIRLGL